MTEAQQHGGSITISIARSLLKCTRSVLEPQKSHVFASASAYAMILSV